MSWFSSNFLDPIENVGKAIFTGDIMGGQNQASGSDWAKAGLDVGALALGGIGAAGLAGVGPAAGALGGVGTDIGSALGFGEATAPAVADTSLDATAMGLTPAGSTIATADPYAAFAEASPAEMGVETTPWGQMNSLDAAVAGNATGGGAGGAGGTGGGGISGWFSNLGNQIMKDPLKDLGIVASGAGLAANLVRGNPTSANQQNMSNIAGYGVQQAEILTPEAAALRGYLENGTLPPGMQAQVTQANAAAKAAIISNAAKNGGSTDPTQNSQLAADLAANDRNSLILATQMETALFQQGQNLLSSALNAAGVSGQLYTSLAQMDQAQQNNLTQAIGNFASAAAGPKLSLSLGGTK